MKVAYVNIEQIRKAGFLKLHELVNELLMTVELDEAKRLLEQCGVESE